MMVSSVIPPAEDEGAKVDGAVEAGGVAVSVRGCLDLSCALLCRTVVASMAHITEKVRRLEKGDRKNGGGSM